MRSYPQIEPGALISRTKRTAMLISTASPRYWLSNLIQTRSAVGSSLIAGGLVFPAGGTSTCPCGGNYCRPMDVVLRGMRADHENCDGDARPGGNRNAHLRVRVRLQRNSRRAPSLAGGDDSAVEGRLGPACKRRPCVPMPSMTSTENRQTHASDHAAAIARWDDEGGAPSSGPHKNGAVRNGEHHLEARLNAAAWHFYIAYRPCRFFTQPGSWPKTSRA
jgi:hypothetical protein